MPSRAKDGASPRVFPQRDGGARPYRLRWQRSRTRNNGSGLVWLWSGPVHHTPDPPAKDEDQGPQARSSRVANNLEKAVIVRLSVVEAEVVRRDSGESEGDDALTWPRFTASGASHSPPQRDRGRRAIIVPSRCTAPIAIIAFRWGKKTTLADACAKW